MKIEITWHINLKVFCAGYISQGIVYYIHHQEVFFYFVLFLITCNTIDWVLQTPHSAVITVIVYTTAAFIKLNLLIILWFLYVVELVRWQNILYIFNNWKSGFLLEKNMLFNVVVHKPPSSEGQHCHSIAKNNIIIINKIKNWCFCL